MSSPVRWMSAAAVRGRSVVPAAAHASAETARTRTAPARSFFIFRNLQKLREQPLFEERERTRFPRQRQVLDRARLFGIRRCGENARYQVKNERSHVSSSKRSPDVE